MALNITRFLTAFRYQSRAPVPELLRDLEQLGRLDARAEKQLGAMRLLTWLTLLPGGMLALLTYSVWAGTVKEGVDLVEEGARLLQAGALFAATLIVAGVFLLLRRSTLKPRDLDNRRYGLARVLLSRFQVDLAPDAEVRLRLDLRPPDVREKRVKEDDLPGGWFTRFYVDPWFTLEARLADGTFLRIHMVQHHQRRERAKTSASGRTKVKTKQKGFARLQVSVRVKPERYPGLETLKARATAATRLPRRVALERVRVGADRLSLRVRLADDWVARAERAPDDPETPTFWTQALAKDDASRTATMMLLSLYQVLGHARKDGKRRASRGRRQSV